MTKKEKKMATQAAASMENKLHAEGVRNCKTRRSD